MVRHGGQPRSPVRLGFVVPRYGREVVGGAETLCRQYAERLVARGHHVEVFTTCALDHFTWRNEVPAGDSVLDGVRVHRFPVTYSKDLRLVAAIEHEISLGGAVDTLAELAWVMNSGASEQMLDALATTGGRLDVLLFLPYLFASTCFGAQVVPDRSLIIPCLHDEPYARFHVLQQSMRNVRGLIFNSPGERDLALTLLREVPPHRVVGAGFDEPPSAAVRPSPPARLPYEYVAYTGRREAGKNWPLLVAWMTLYSRALSSHGPLRLVTIGSGTVQVPVPARDIVVDLGYATERAKNRILRDAVVTAQLSRNESFSYAIFESWLARTPVVVHSACPVTRGFCEQSGGGLWAANEDEFAVILDELRGNDILRSRLAERGYAFVMEGFRWPVVLDRLERAVEELAA
jgi:glycosyltransferase involved in cell wall biosynthesis